METCEICGKEIKTAFALKAHMKSHEKKLDESKKAAAPAAEKLIQPEIVTESKEIKETVTKKDNEFVSVNEAKDSDLVQTYKNPYKDMYKDEGEVMTEWL